MNNKICKNKGITLISLVITIILLIILSGITISLLLSDNGILKKAESVKKIQDVATLQEALELEKTPIQIENAGNVDLESYLKQIQEGKKTYTLNSVKQLDESNAEGEYKFLVSDKKNGDVEIVYQGKVGSESLTLSSYERNCDISSKKDIYNNQ